MNARGVILVAFALALFWVGIKRLRIYRLKERHAIVLVLTGLPFLFFAAWQAGVVWLANKLDIDYRTLELLGVSAFLLLMVVELFTIVSLQDRRISNMAQIVGILMQKHSMNDRDTRPPVPQDDLP